MTQQVIVTAQLGPAYSAATVSFKIFNSDGTMYADWTSSGFSQIGSTGTFLKANVSTPDSGGYIQFSTDGGNTLLGAIADIQAINVNVSSMSANSVTASSLATDAVAEIQNGLSTLTAQQVWEYASRSLTTFGTLVADIWSNASRTLSAFGFSVTVGTNNDKTGYGLTTTPPTSGDITTDILTESYQGRTIRDVLLDIWKVVVGNSVSDDSNDPTTTTHKSPDESSEITLTYTDTTRDWSE